MEERGPPWKVTVSHLASSDKERKANSSHPSSLHPAFPVLSSPYLTGPSVEVLTKGSCRLASPARPSESFGSTRV